MTSKQTIKKGVPSRPTKTTGPSAASQKPAVVKQQTPPRAVKGAPKPKTQKTNVRAGIRPTSAIPRADATSGLRMKMPKSKEANIHKRLQKQSPWFQSIQDPLHGADCKIPDETGVETGTVQLVQRVAVTSNSNGITGYRVISPYANNEVTGDADGSNWQIQDPAAVSDLGLGWGNGSPYVASEALAFTGVEELKAITNAHRIVSACVTVVPETALADNKGEICMFSHPFGFSDSPNYTDYLNSYKSIIVPINQNKPATVRWYPVSREDWSFKSFIDTTGTTLSRDDDAAGAYPAWSFGFIVTGAEPDCIFRVTTVVNYEFIPRYNTLNVLSSGPSPSDVTEIDLVERWTQDMPVASVTSQSQAASSPSTVEPQHGDNDAGTGFGMFFNVLTELAPLALALL